MLKLCGVAVSNYYNTDKLQLIEKGVPFEEEIVSPSQADEVLARTAMGKVPFVEVNGHTLAESQVISEYIEEVYAAHPLLPRDPIARAKVRELIEFIELHLELVARGSTAKRSSARPRRPTRRSGRSSANWRA
jgi:glutathione S-transferase